MVFSSLIFLFLFLPLTVIVYYAMPQRLRNAVLLFASVVFYAWGEGVYALVMLVSICANWVLVLAMDRSQGVGRRRGFLILAVVLNLGALTMFKYLGFIVATLNPVLAAVHLPVLRWSAVHLPIGISFYTFHALSYVIDVYRKETPVQRRLDLLMLYIALFPQLIAGPIVRYHDVAKQLLRRNLDIAGIVSGLRRFTVGLAKKTILANPMGATADTIFALSLEQLSPGTAWIGLISYALQIYFDFSGYSDMAIGLARMFGFEFPENFNYPYIAQSLSDFWRRWHISLSTWLRDYLYVPLGGNRVGRWRTYVNLCVVFLLCGLWHGASWSFVLWGGLHGAVLVFERVGLARLLAFLPRPARTLFVLGVVAIGWVLFRCETLADAGHFFGAMFGRSGSVSAGYGWQAYLTPYLLVVWLVGVVAATPLITTRYTRVVDATAALARLGPGFCHAFVHSALFVIAVAHLAAGTHNPFIYFRF